MVPFVQDFPTQEKLASHAPDELFVVRCTGWVFTVFDISLISWYHGFPSASTLTFMNSSLFMQ